MLSRATRAVMALAAFVMAFALVCPVAVTPIFVTNHHAPTVIVAVVIAIIVPIVITFSAAACLEEFVVPLSSDTTALTCVRLC